MFITIVINFKKNSKVRNTLQFQKKLMNEGKVITARKKKKYKLERDTLERLITTYPDDPIMIYAHMGFADETDADYASFRKEYLVPALTELLLKQFSKSENILADIKKAIDFSAECARKIDSLDASLARALRKYIHGPNHLRLSIEISKHIIENKDPIKNWREVMNLVLFSESSSKDFSDKAYKAVRAQLQKKDLAGDAHEEVADRITSYFHREGY